MPDGHIQGIELIHLGNSPRALVPMPSHVRALVAGLAQGHHREVLTLLDVVCITGARLSTD